MAVPTTDNSIFWFSIASVLEVKNNVQGLELTFKSILSTAGKIICTVLQYRSLTLTE